MLLYDGATQADGLFTFVYEMNEMGVKAEFTDIASGCDTRIEIVMVCHEVSSRDGQN